MHNTVVAAAAAIVIAAGTAVAQTAAEVEEQVRARQRMATMEAVLTRAILNGADNVLRQVQHVMPDRPMLSGNPRAHGVRLGGYGVIFYVQVPDMVLPIMWPLRQMVHETQARQAEQMLMRLRVEAARLQGEDRARLQRVIADLETQLLPPRGVVTRDSRGVTAAALTPPAAAPPAGAVVESAVVDDPQEAYTREVKAALLDAMLENGQGLAIAPDEWLTIAAHTDVAPNPVLPGDTVDNSTWILRIRGSDLDAFRAKTLSLEQARAKVEVQEQ